MPNPTKEKSNKPGKTHQDEKALFLSVVVPLMDEEESLQELYNQILHAVTPIGKPFELIFVDDGSTDGSYRILEELHGHDKRIKVIRFRRNFGKSAALSVGFKEAEGEFVVTMDADLQDDPAEIPG
ncbi:MAG: glycosyltransferase, partial [Ignavibacteriales bacterium]|nr:glycosyltransferase [Ignavibacteriales bacterium]